MKSCGVIIHKSYRTGISCGTFKCCEWNLMVLQFGQSCTQTDATTPNIVWAKTLTGFKLCATTPNNTQQGVQTDPTCNIQQCLELLAYNVAFICKAVMKATEQSVLILILYKVVQTFVSLDYMLTSNLSLFFPWHCLFFSSFQFNFSISFIFKGGYVGAVVIEGGKKEVVSLFFDRGGRVSKTEGICSFKGNAYEPNIFLDSRRNEFFFACTVENGGVANSDFALRSGLHMLVITKRTASGAHAANTKTASTKNFVGYTNKTHARTAGYYNAHLDR